MHDGAFTLLSCAVQNVGLLCSSLLYTWIQSGFGIDEQHFDDMTQAHLTPKKPTPSRHHEPHPKVTVLCAALFVVPFLSAFILLPQELGTTKAALLRRLQGGTSKEEGTVAFTGQ